MPDPIYMREIRNAIILLCAIIIVIAGNRIAVSEQNGDVGPPGPDEVLIGPNAIIMPLGKILLIRKGSDYGAVKFTKFWTGKTEEDLYARYESYYQDDKTGNFSNKNVKYVKDKLYDPKPSLSIFGHPWAPSAKKKSDADPLSFGGRVMGRYIFLDGTRLKAITVLSLLPQNGARYHR